MKKIVSLLLTAGLMIGCLAGCGSSNADTNTGSGTETTAESNEAANDDAADSTVSEYSVAMVTDYGDITDQSFNQTTYEACKAFCEAQGIEFNYYKPSGDSTAERVASVEKAIDDGFNVIVMPGFAFGSAIFEAAPKHKDIKFIALDVGKGDILETAVAAKGEKYSYNPDDYKLEDYADLSNVYCAVYQ